LDGGRHLVMEQEPVFKVPPHYVNTLFAVGLEGPHGSGAISSCGRAVRGQGPRCGFCGMAVGLIGEQAVHGDQDEMGEQLWLNPALGFGVNLFDVEHALAHLGECLDAPAGRGEIPERLKRIRLEGVTQGGAQAKDGAGDLIFQEPQAQRENGERGSGCSDVSWGAWGGKTGDRAGSLRTGNKLLNRFAPAVLEPEYGMDSGVDVLMEQDGGARAALGHHDVVSLQRRQVLAGTLSLIARRDEVKSPRHL